MVRRNITLKPPVFRKQITLQEPRNDSLCLDAKRTARAHRNVLLFGLVLSPMFL